MPRKKHLILTYGVTAGRQRTVRLSLSRVNAFLLAMTVTAVWATGSFGYLLFAGFRTEATAVATVPPKPVKIDCPVVKAVPIPPPAPAPVPVCAPVERLAPVAVERPAEEPPKLAASLENYRAVESVGKLVTHFSVRNLTQGTLRGKVRGEAEFVALDGSLKTITSEQDYKARTISGKDLVFKAPGPGKFTKVKITVDDRATQRDVVFFR